MLMQSVDLADIVTIREVEGPTVLKTNSPYIPSDQRNIAWKAVEQMKVKYGIEKNVEIILEKNIPVAAGLAGGSTDAAAVLIGLNRLWDLDLNTEQLMEEGLKLGADVPFCIKGGTARAEGIGEILTSMRIPAVFWLVIIKPHRGISTREVYTRLNMEKIEMHPKIENIMEGLATGNPVLFATELGNVLETVTLNYRPEVIKVKQKLMEAGALTSLMSGSGPSVFGLFLNKERALKAYRALKRRYRECYMVPIAQMGVSVVEYTKNEELDNP